MIRGLTLEQIEEAVEEASKNYNGNIELAGFSHRVTLDEPVEHSYESNGETYTYTTNFKYEYTKGIPLNKRGDGWRIKLRVLSSRRPGSRVSNNQFMDKPRRIASACWHSHRDVFRAMFAINPDTRIKTALAHYKGEEDFEDTFFETGCGHSGPFGYAIPGVGDACNCDEGNYPEYAVEGLREEQYDARLIEWDDPYGCLVKKPKREKAIIQEEATTCEA